MGKIKLWRPPLGQMGFFDVQNRLRSLDKAGDPLEILNNVIPWEEFRDTLRQALRNRERKSAAGRPPHDEVLMFKILVLQSLYNLADDRVEYQIKDRLSFMRFLGIGTEGIVPDAKTIWLYRNELSKDGWGEKLFQIFDGYLNKAGFSAKKGQIVDATFVEVPRQRNSKDENDQIKEGKVPEEWQSNPNKLRQKDVDARWTKKNEENHYGYKNHVNIDRKHKLIRNFKVTAASVHDSQALEDILDTNNGSRDIWADSAYKSEKIENLLEGKGIRSHIHDKGIRNHPLNELQKKWNHARSKIRVRVEHVFGHFAASMNDREWTRGVGEVRIRMKVSMRNLTYNFWRFSKLQAA